MHAPARPPTRRLPASPAAAGAAAHLSGPQAAPPRRQRPKLTRPLRLPRLHPACTLQRRLEIATYSPLTRYNFQVWARNTAGWGDPSTPPVVYRAPNVSWSRFLCVPCPFALECMHVVRAWLGLVGVRGAWRPSRPAAPINHPAAAAAAPAAGRLVRAGAGPLRQLHLLLLHDPCALLPEGHAHRAAGQLPDGEARGQRALRRWKLGCWAQPCGVGVPSWHSAALRALFPAPSGCMSCPRSGRRPVPICPASCLPDRSALNSPSTAARAWTAAAAAPSARRTLPPTPRASAARRAAAGCSGTAAAAAAAGLAWPVVVARPLGVSQAGREQARRSPVRRCHACSASQSPSTVALTWPTAAPGAHASATPRPTPRAPAWR